MPPTYRQVAPTIETMLREVGEVRLAGYSSVGVDAFHFPQECDQRSWQWADVVGINRGRHSLRFGFEVRRIG